MYYDHLGGNSYQVTLKFYRDCGPDNVNGTGFDDNVSIGVFDASGNLLFTESMFDPGESVMPIELNNPCLTAPDVCIATTEYSGVIDLPPIPGGYTLSYTRCCRTPAVVNLNDAGSQGLTCVITIPGPPNAANSSPRFPAYPPLALCLGQDMVFDHAATDPDGDQLVYELCAPFQGGSTFEPIPLSPPPPPYTEVFWGPGYSANFPMDGSPGMAVNAATGELTVHPTLQGAFTVGLRVKEFRNGVLLGETRRDLKFLVVNCEVTVISAIQEQLQFCQGLTVEMENESVNGDFWFWDFGDPSTLADTSNLTAPTYTYADTGIYTITLVANPGWPCADTSTSIYRNYLELAPHFDRPPIRCPDEIAQFTGTGNFTANADLSWDMGDVGTPGTGQGAHAQAMFPQPGVHPVRFTISEHGCSETYIDSVVVFPHPTVGLIGEPEVCAGGTIAFEEQADAWTSLSYLWDFGDGGTSTEPAPVHPYEFAGVYTVSLTVTTDSGCISERTLVRSNMIDVHPNPVAAFQVTPNSVSLLDPEVLIEDRSDGASLWMYNVENSVYHDPDVVHVFEEAGRFELMQTVTTEYGCVDTTYRIVYVTDHLFYAPTAFTPDGDGLNDTFAPLVRGARTFELVIYDRWGIERFRTTDPRGEWSGDGLPQGVFNYVARIAEYGSYHKEYVGSFALLR